MKDIKNLFLEAASELTPEIDKKVVNLKNAFKLQIARLQKNLDDHQPEVFIKKYLKSDKDSWWETIDSLRVSKTFTKTIEEDISKFKSYYKDLFQEEYVYNKEDLNIVLKTSCNEPGSHIRSR